MNIAFCVVCLVIVAILDGATSFPDKKNKLEEQSHGSNDDHHERQDLTTRKPCKDLGGECQPKGEACNGVMKFGKKFCMNAKNCGCCIPPACVWGFKAYPHGAHIEDACIELECDRGNWKYIGESEQECGYCELEGDPHITPYELHNVVNNSKPITLKSYDNYDIGRMVVSQPLEPLAEVFGVHAEFESCLTSGGDDHSCVSKVFYYEPGLDITLELPVNLTGTGDYTYCHDDSDNWAKPECSETKIFVGGNIQPFVNGAPATSFYGTSGTVLIFTEECTPAQPSSTPICQYIYIVGSKGFSVKLMVDPSYGSFYTLNIYASQSKLLNKVQGLCDVFTGAIVTDGFTSSDGTKIKDFNNLAYFKDSWIVDELWLKECPEGTFFYAQSKQCFRLLNDRLRNFTEAQAACSSLGLQLAHPSEPVLLRYYLITEYGLANYVWLFARGDNVNFVWLDNGENISNDSPLWYAGQPHVRVTTDNCLVFQAGMGWWKPYPNQPYGAGVCSYNAYPLCEYR